MLLSYKELGYFDKALNFVNANKTKYDNAYAHFIVGIIYMDTKQYEQAKEEFLISIKMEDGNVMPYIYLARVYMQENNFKQAKLFLAKASSLNDEHALIDFLYALIYFKEKNSAQAKKYAQSAMKKSLANQPFIYQQSQKLNNLIG
jgi:tetratricopeptide (TPR) repeat protein